MHYGSDRYCIYEGTWTWTPPHQGCFTYFGDLIATIPKATFHNQGYHVVNVTNYVNPNGRTRFLMRCGAEVDGYEAPKNQQTRFQVEDGTRGDPAMKPYLLVTSTEPQEIESSFSLDVDVVASPDVKGACMRGLANFFG